MSSPIEWQELKLPPINLWSAPKVMTNAEMTELRMLLILAKMKQNEQKILKLKPIAQAFSGVFT